MRVTPTQQSIIKTLIYSKCFRYAMTSGQLYTLLIIPYAVDFCDFLEELEQLIKRKVVICKKNMYTLKDDIPHIERTRKNRISSRKKNLYRDRAIHLLRWIPTIQFIGLSGSMAMENSDKKDDIDFFIITSTGSVWLTRFFSILLLDIFGLRRKPHGVSANKICLNMFIDEDSLSLKPYDRDLFSAHEVVQVKPLLNRNNVYERFLKANGWVREYLGNSFQNAKLQMPNDKWEKRKTISSVINICISSLTFLLEGFANYLQLLYMKKKRTREVVEEGYVRFHPHDARQYVLPVYQKNVKKILKRLEKSSSDFSEFHALNPGGFFSSVH